MRVRVRVVAEGGEVELGRRVAGFEMGALVRTAELDC